MNLAVLALCLSVSMGSAALSWNISYTMSSRGWYYMTAAFILTGYNKAAMYLKQPIPVTQVLWVLVGLLLLAGLILIRRSMSEEGKSRLEINSDLEDTVTRFNNGSHN